MRPEESGFLAVGKEAIGEPAMEQAPRFAALSSMPHPCKPEAAGSLGDDELAWLITSQDLGVHSANSQIRAAESRHSFMSTTYPADVSAASSCPPNRLLHDAHAIHVKQLLQETFTQPSAQLASIASAVASSRKHVVQ